MLINKAALSDDFFESNRPINISDIKTVVNILTWDFGSRYVLPGDNVCVEGPIDLTKIQDVN